MRELGACKSADKPTGDRAEQTARLVTTCDEIDNPVLSGLFAYWDGKRGRRSHPSRRDLDPADIPALLPNLFLIAVRRRPFDLTFRLTGTAVVASNGVECTGRRLIDLPSSAAEALYRQSARAVRSGRPVMLSGPLHNRVGAYQRVDHLILPLGEEPGVVDMLLGGAVYRPYPAGGPRNAAMRSAPGAADPNAGRIAAWRRRREHEQLYS